MNKASTPRRTKPKSAAPLGPGLHPATLEMAADEGAYRVRTADGRLLVARRAPEVTDRFMRSCLRARRTVLLVDGAQGPLVLGALQTDVATRVDANEQVSIEGKRIDLAASERVSIQVGESRLTLEKDGSVRLVGDRMTIDMGALLQILSSNVLLP